MVDSPADGAPFAHSYFPPIEDYAFLSDCETTALVAIGELTKARTLCSKLLSSASPLQLYAEEIDPRSGRHLGNFPQAFTHLGLINAVTAVIEGERQLMDRGRLNTLGSD